MKKIIGLGNALTDVLAPIESDEILQKLSLPKGSMTWVDKDKLMVINELFSHMKTHLTAGGSAGNVVRALGRLGADTGFIGKVGQDAYGEFYRNSLAACGAETHLLVSPDEPSGVANTFISPDGERTFGDYMGAALTLSADELNPGFFKGCSYLFIEGYLVQDRDLILKAVQLAKADHLQVCLDMASYNVVADNLAFFNELVDNYVDILFANEDEAKAFTGKEGSEALSQMAARCEIAVLKLGKEGAMACRGSDVFRCQAMKVDKVADTTAAGDYFAAGFLYGLACGSGLTDCVKFATRLAGEIVQVVGTELPDETWESIRQVRPVEPEN